MFNQPGQDSYGTVYTCMYDTAAVYGLGPPCNVHIDVQAY